VNEDLRNRIVHLFEQGATKCAIARETGVSPRTVGRVVADVERGRHGPDAGGDPARGRPSRLDPFVGQMKELLGRYPLITAVRMHEELRRSGYRGSYPTVQRRLRTLRPTPLRPPVARFETAPGAQAQMDFGVYDIDFVAEGRRRVYLFGYILGYSRRQYLRFGESQDFETTVREHIHAFEHLGGAAATCLYDNMKVVVSRHDGDEPIYNTRFLAFATHYGFRPRACRPRRPQTKGKIERQFHYVEVNLLNGRTFQSLEHLNQTAEWWLANVADVRVHRETKRRPIDMHAEEQPRLLPLPAHPYDADPVVYRNVNVEGFLSYRQNFYSAPWRYIGAVLPVRIGESELVVYSPTLEEIARHPRMPRTVVGRKVETPAHRPSLNRREQLETLRQRFEELGPIGLRFFDRLLEVQRHGKAQAKKVLMLLSVYRRSDLQGALERALRYGAVSSQAVERILAVGAKPKPLLEALADEEREHLDSLLNSESVGPRSTGDYQSLLFEEPEDGQEESKPDS
jgi:transposase